MAAVHFTPIPCEPYTAHKVQGKPYFCNICPCANDIVYAKLKQMLGLYETVLVAIFFSYRGLEFPRHS